MWQLGAFVVLPILPAIALAQTASHAAIHPASAASGTQSAEPKPAPSSDSVSLDKLTAPTDTAVEDAMRGTTIAPEQRGGLTLQAVLQEVLSRGFETRLASIAVDAAKGDARAFSAFANPSAALTFGRALGYSAQACGGSGCSANQYTIGLSDSAALSDLLSGKHSLRKDIGRQLVRISSLQRDDAIRVARLTAKQQYAQVVYAQAKLQLANRVLASARGMEDLVRLRYNSGAPLPDLLRAEAVALDAQQRLRAAQTQLISEKSDLALLMGRSGIEGMSIDDGLLTEDPPMVDPEGSTPHWIEQARTHRPDRMAAQVAVEQSDVALRLARRNRWPDIELQLGYTQQGWGNSAIQPGTVSVGVAAPIPLLYQNQGQIDRAVADASARSIERQKLDQQITANVKTSLIKVDSALNQAKSAHEQLIRARKAFEMVKLQYQEGATSLVDLLQAIGAATDAEDNSLDAKETFWEQVFQLEYDSGKEFVK